MASDYIVASDLEPALRVGFLGLGEGEVLPASKRLQPKLIANQPGNSMSMALEQELRGAEAFQISVAFVTVAAVDLIREALTGSGNRDSRRGVIVTSDYLGFNAPEVFVDLMQLREYGIETRVYRGPGFHPKGYVFKYSRAVTAILGSANLTTSAITKNVEWNIRVAAMHESTLALELEQAFGEQLEGSELLSEAWIQAYRNSWSPPVRRQLQATVSPEVVDERVAELVPASLGGHEGAADGGGSPQSIQPNAMQADALRRIAEVRNAGHPRALVISATGTGKTILSALDVRSVNPRRVLFVAHREQILKKSMDAFQAVLEEPSEAFGLLSGTRKEFDRRYVFATVQSLVASGQLQNLAPESFDYIVIDEAHRAGASSFRRVLDHFRPRFCLGMTATPERTDGHDIFELFDHRVAYEIRLREALEEGMLVPFHYYGVADYVSASGEQIGDISELKLLVAEERVSHVLDQIGRRVSAARPVRGLIFCSRNSEAQEIARELSQRSLFGKRLRAVALSGATPQPMREELVRQLEEGALDYLVTVDIFNEGVDIPSVNQIIMLRQTQSPIVFVQQLGRGLRKCRGKESVTVIDFIGNYANNYMIPIALFGNHSLNKDSLRKSLSTSLEGGQIFGLSTVRFDAISRERILDAIAQSKIDGLKNLKEQLALLRQRLGRTPRLWDFEVSDLADPVIVARVRGSYPAFLAATGEKLGFSRRQLEVLSMLTAEGLGAKRPHELLVVRALLAGRGVIGVHAVAEVLRAAGAAGGDEDVASVLRVLLGRFSTLQERTKYGAPVCVQSVDGTIEFAPEVADWLETDSFRGELLDLVDTGLAVIEKRYDASRPFTIGQQYSRKDACRQLNWVSNMTSTIYGYKVDQTSATCPIFITYHKSGDVAQSIAYEDHLLDEQNLLWFSRARRSLRSAEVKEVLKDAIIKHIFVKKDDADGSDFYYLGTAMVCEAVDAVMPDKDGGSLSVVKMKLRLEAPLSHDLYSYFEPDRILE